MDSKTIIQRLGGPVKVAELCGGDITPQAVSMWYGIHTGNDRRKGLPRKIPKAWLQFLKTVRPDAFAEPKPSQSRKKARAQ